MKKYLLIINLAAVFAFCSCTNITFADFTPNDIGNIISFLIFNPDSETAEQTEPDILEEYIFEIIEPESLTVSQSAQPASETTIPTITESEQEEDEENEDNENNEEEQDDSLVPETDEAEDGTAPVTPESYETHAADSSERSEIRIDTVFPDVPEIFRRLRFPSNLKMTDTLKNALINLEPFSVRKFDGVNFRIATTESMLFTPILGGGDLSDLRNYRSRLVQEACGVRLAVTPWEPESLLPVIEREVNAGNYISDILCVPLEIQARLAEKGLLMNLRKIPFINLKAEYYNQSAAETSSINNNTYSLVSDMMFNPNHIYAMFYNKDIIRKYDLEDPVDLYNDDVWTYDNMFVYSRALDAAASGLNVLGIDAGNTDIINGLFTASGNNYFAVGSARTYPVMNFNNSRTHELIESLEYIFSQPELNFLTSDEAAQYRAFTDGTTLFSISKLDIIPDIAEIDFDWGILPVPTLNDAESGVRSFVSKDALGLSVLRGTPDTEISGMVTEAMSIASYGIFRETYIREQLMYTLRNVWSVRVLNDILNNVTYNQYNIYGGIDSIHSATAGVIEYAAGRQGVFEVLYENGGNRLNDFFNNSPAFFRN